MGYAKEINKMVFSFSRIHCWETCPFTFYLKYIEKRDGDSNFWAANGKIMHSIFERLLKHELILQDAPAEYIEEFETIYETTKQSTMDNTFNKCLDYLCEVEAFDEKKYEILGVELKLEFKIGKYNFIGYADLVLKERVSGKIILVDHKSCDHFMKKDGITPLKNMEEQLNAYKHQMYIYCKGLKDIFGYNVDALVWNHFKDGGKLSVVNFDKNEFEETIDWATQIIDKIKKDNKFECNKSYMMCWQLCDFRNNCEYLEEEGDSY